MTNKKNQKEVLKLVVKPVGNNGYWELRNELDEFVQDNFDILYEGAVRLGCQIEEDYYAPRRIQINKTRLHQNIGLKYADGHKYNWWDTPSEEQLRQTVKDIQQLIDASAEEYPAPFTLKIIDNRVNGESK